MGTRAPFDPELVYVECGRCGEPVLWEPGQTTEVLYWAGVNAFELDSSCLIVSDGCPACNPEEHVFDTQIVKLTGEVAAK